MNCPTSTVARHGRTAGRTRPTREVGAFDSEASLHAEVSAFLRRLEIPHKNQHAVGAGFADVALELPDGTPWALVELKLTTPGLSLADAADYFEQAAKYRLESGLPVFVGPFMAPSMAVVDDLYCARYPNLSALSALGGRMDVGLFFLHAIKGCETRQHGWYAFQFVLRQTRVAVHHTGELEHTLWPSAQLPLVDLATAGSRKDRR